MLVGVLTLLASSLAATCLDRSSSTNSSVLARSSTCPLPTRVGFPFFPTAYACRM